MKYRNVDPISRAGAERALQSEDPSEVCDALIRITFHEADWRWIQSQCIRLIHHNNKDVRGLAATCLGHIARIHGKLDSAQVLPLLEMLMGDPDVGGRAEDAIDDIRRFMKP